MSTKITPTGIQISSTTLNSCSGDAYEVAWEILSQHNM